MKHDYSGKTLPSSYPRGSNSRGSSGVGNSSGDENSYGEEVVQLQRRRQRTPPPPLNTFVDKVAGKVYQQTHLLGESSDGYVHVTVDENGEKVALKTLISDTASVAVFGQQLVAGVAHLHSLGLVHCDLKTLNLLLTEDLVLKVSDFGQARDLKESKKLPDVVGSLGFQSPEVPGEIPDGKTKPVQAYAKMSANARDLLQRTLEYEPNNRIKMPDLLAHPFLINEPSLPWQPRTTQRILMARAIAADRTLKQKGNKDVAVCGGKKVWDDDSDDEEEEVKGHKKVKVMQKGAASENKAAEDKEGDHGGDQDAWPTHLFNL
ncbi:kinase-like domain-containing protein [Linnemannia elongata]|nr:kinase-like domain-containing protein [Linnemannia elongata]